MKDNIKQASKLLQCGKLVCFPTETVYALSADISNAQAIHAIYQLKGRKKDNPLSVMVPSVELAKELLEFTPLAEALAAQYLPGPLTLVLPKNKENSQLQHINPDHDTLAIRIPDHPFALPLLRHYNKPIAATSCNPSGDPAATTADEVKEYFGNQVNLIIEESGGHSGVASTVVNACGSAPVILRQGAVKL